MNTKAYSGIIFLVEVLLLYAYKVALDLIFLDYSLPLYNYEPYYSLYGAIEPFRFVLGYVVLPFLWFFSRPILKNPRFGISRMLITFQLLFIVIPSFTVYAQVERPQAHVFWILLGFAILVLTVRGLPSFSVPAPSKEASFFLTSLAYAVLLYVYGGLVLTGGLQRINLNLLEVYAFREEFVQRSLPLFNYFIPWVAYVINMALLVYAVVRKKRAWTVLVVAFQVLLFAMTNFKAFLFLPFLVLAFLWILPRVAFPRLVLLGTIGLLIALWTLAILGQPLGLGIADRIFYLPAAMQSLYFDYFSAHPLARMSGSPWVDFLRLESPYSTTSVSLIAQEYWGRDFSPNVGWIASAFADFGVLGIIGFGFALGLFLRLADAIAGQVRIRGAAEALFIGPALALTNASLTTSLITHGGLVALLALWILARKLGRPQEAARAIQPSVAANKR